MACLRHTQIWTVEMSVGLEMEDVIRLRCAGYEMIEAHPERAPEASDPQRPHWGLGQLPCVGSGPSTNSIL